MPARKLIAVFLLSAALAACSPGHEGATIQRPAVSGVVLSTIEPVSVAEHYEATGTVTARTTSAVSSRVMGAVTKVHVREGDRVNKGDALMSIDARDLGERVSQAESAYNEAMKALSSATEQRELARTTFERFEKLHQQNALSTQELDRVRTERNVAEHEYERIKAMVERAEAGMKEAKVYMGFATITSPVGGIVSRKMTDPGSMASPGVPLMIIEDNSSYRVEASVDERFLHSVAPGMKAEVNIESLGRKIMGKVVEVVPSVDPVTRTFPAKIELEGQSGLRSGQYAKVHFVTGQSAKLLVPTDAVVLKGQLSGVYRVNADKVIAYRLVKTGRQYGAMIEVLSGLSSGDTIVVGNIDNAIDGGVLTDAPSREK